MGQQDIYQFLRKNKGKWFTSREIREALQVGPSSISTCLKSLRSYKGVFFKESPEKRGTFIYSVFEGKQPPALK